LVATIAFSACRVANEASDTSSGCQARFCGEGRADDDLVGAGRGDMLPNESRVSCVA